MGHWNYKLDMAGTLTTYLFLGDFHTASVADDAFVSDTLVLSAGTLEILCRTEDALSEESVALRFVCTVVYGFRLGNLTE